MNPLQKIGTFGQSVWLDFISRKALQDGTLQKYIADGVVGMTSNPAIFGKAMSGDDYDKEIATLGRKGQSANEIYDQLAIEDVQNACDLLHPVFNRSNGLDGYVSLEVSPHLARDTSGTIEAAQTYWSRLKRENAMIKIPATMEGVPAVTEVLSKGINVNVTLLFSVNRYEMIIDAFMSGLEKLSASGGDLSKVRSVASFFLSRIDTMVDEDLEKIGSQEALGLRGKAAIACAKHAYELYEKHYSSGRWTALADKGAHPQRLLWASTSTKNPNYPDTMYVEPLIGPETVNTLPPETIAQYLDHGDPADRIHDGWNEVHANLTALATVGIDLKLTANRLEEEGLVKFVEPFEKLAKLLEAKRKSAVSVQSDDEAAIARALAETAASL